MNNFLVLAKCQAHMHYLIHVLILLKSLIYRLGDIIIPVLQMEILIASPIHKVDDTSQSIGTGNSIHK